MRVGERKGESLCSERIFRERKGGERKTKTVKLKMKKGRENGSSKEDDGVIL